MIRELEVVVVLGIMVASAVPVSALFHGGIVSYFTGLGQDNFKFEPGVIQCTPSGAKIRPEGSGNIAFGMSSTKTKVTVTIPGKTPSSMFFDTPIGKISVPIYGMEGIAAINLDLTGSLKGSVSASGAGSIGQNSLSWSNWGSQQVTVTTSKSAKPGDKISVTLEPKYVLTVGGSVDVLGGKTSIRGFDVDLFRIDSCTATVEILKPPDLAISPADISFNPKSAKTPTEGDPITISATIRNTGEDVADSAEVAFYNGNPSAGGTQIGTQKISSVSGNGGTQIASVSWSPTAGSYTIYVAISNSNPSESDITNNQAFATLTVSKPPLPLLPIAIGILAVAGIAVVFVIKKKKKKT